MMIDWVSPPPAGGCGRSFFAGRPRALRGRAGSGLTAAWRELAAVIPIGVMIGAPCRTRDRVTARSPWTQAGASAPSPSSARMCTACRMILRASEMAARLPSIRSLTAV